MVYREKLDCYHIVLKISRYLWYGVRINRVQLLSVGGSVGENRILLFLARLNQYRSTTSNGTIFVNRLKRNFMVYLHCDWNMLYIFFITFNTMHQMLLTNTSDWSKWITRYKWIDKKTTTNLWKQLNEAPLHVWYTFKACFITLYFLFDVLHNDLQTPDRNLLIKKMKIPKNRCHKGMLHVVRGHRGF